MPFSHALVAFFSAGIPFRIAEEPFRSAGLAFFSARIPFFSPDEAFFIDPRAFRSAEVATPTGFAVFNRGFEKNKNAVENRETQFPSVTL